MDNSVYITLSRQLALFRDMEVTANNIANMNTAGYQASHVLFEDYLMTDSDRKKMAFANDIATYRDVEGGSMRTTGNPLDVAIGGDGYFTVETPLGSRYTRSGGFQIDGEGTLVNPEGYPVLDANGARIVFNEADREITVGGLGNIGVDGEERARLAVVTFENPQTLQARGERLFTTDEEPQQVDDPRVMQGVLENSNVKPVLEMTHMIDVSRAVGNTAKFIEVMYDLQRKTTNTWTQQTA